MTSRKQVLIIVSKRPQAADGMNWDGLTAWLDELLDGAATVRVAALPELVYVVGKKMAIYDPVQGFDLADFDLVIFRTVGEQIELAIPAAHYLQSKGIPFTDDYLLTNGKGKLACSFVRAIDGLPVPQTIYTDKDLMRAALEREELFSYPFIVKADLGKKGRDNYLVHSDDELAEALSGIEGKMIAQEFIPNDGDYRVLVTGDRVEFAMLRKGSGTTHLNNTSQGGAAKLVDPASLPQEIIRDSLRAAALERLQVAGVDVVIDSRNGEYYFLEVNRAPQIPTGAYVDEKMRAYANMMKRYLEQT